MKVFRSKDGRIVQLADKEKMARWDAEMPLLFIGAIKERRLPIYKKEFPASFVKEIEQYLDEVLEEIAVPKLINTLQHGSVEEKLKVAENLFELSQSNPDQIAIALPHIEKAMNDPDKKVAEFMKKTLKNYQRAQKRKKTAEKRKKLNELRKKMDKIDRDFSDGKISDEEYLKEQKKYLKLKREIELEEEVD